MKVLFIVQGEGRGHLTQAIAMEKILTKNGHEVVEVLVGKSEQRRLPGFFSRSIKAPIRQFVSPNFLPSASNKRANLWKSILYNIALVPKFVESIFFINKRIKDSGAELVINFYELLSGFTFLFFHPDVRNICIGHQYLFLHKELRLPEKSRLRTTLLNIFSRMTSIGADEIFALSFRKMERDRKILVIPPLLRKEVFLQTISDGDYIHGYMVNSGFSEYITNWHNANPQIPLRFFWDRWEEESVKKIDDNLWFYQLDDEEFLSQMAGCKAYASTAGFESICEAMYLGKPILMVPAHIEQECNAYDAMLSNAGITDDKFNLDKLLDFSKAFKPDTNFRRWVHSAEYTIINNIERITENRTIENMFMVEEFI